MFLFSREIAALFDNLKSFYMKQKIKEALQQKYKNLGLNEEVFERVAASAETFVTEETLSNFVDGAGTLELLKNYQSFADKARGFDSQEKKRADDLATKLAEAEAKLKDKGGEKTDPPTDIAELVQSAVAAALQPLQTKLTEAENKLKAFEDEGASKQALKAAKDALFGNDYAKKYTQERDAAWERAVEIYEATGKKMTAEELKEKAMGYFNKDVARKGVDTTKPFEAQTDEPETFEKGYFKNLYEKSGRIQKEENV